MLLPNEITVAICESLDKKDLKSVRQVSKSWCSCASGLLFDELHISPNKEDLDVFNAMVEHPQLRVCVRQLIYNGAEFIPKISKTRYFQELMDQRRIVCHRAANLSDPIVIASEDPDPDVQDWIRRPWKSCDEWHSAYNEFSDRAFVRIGWRKYRQHASYQQKLLGSEVFLTTLVQGLQKLKSLQSVAPEGRWAHLQSLDERRRGSPIARSWSNFHCVPPGWSWTSQITSGMEHYRILTAALAKSERHVQSFKVGTVGIPAHLFAGGTRALMDPPRSDVIAFTRLKSLSLVVAACTDELGDDSETQATCDRWPDISGLSDILHTATELEYLRLDMPIHLGEPPTFYSYSQVFRRDARWHILQELELEHLELTAEELLHLVTWQTPNLKRLRIDEINLTRGRWQGVFQALRELPSPPALEFSTSIETFLWHVGVDFQDHFTSETIYPDLIRYVMHGGRHPCLPEGEADAAASQLFVWSAPDW